MPVDEDVLESTINDIKNETQDNFSRGQKLRDLYVDAVSIRLIVEPDPTDDDPENTKKVLPTDTKLGTTITDDRRQTICDKVLSDFAVLKTNS